MPRSPSEPAPGGTGTAALGSGVQLQPVDSAILSAQNPPSVSYAPTPAASTRSDPLPSLLVIRGLVVNEERNYKKMVPTELARMSVGPVDTPKTQPDLDSALRTRCSD